MAKQLTKKRPKTAKKKFIEVEMPLTNTKAHLFGYDNEDLANKTITLDMTRNLRGKNLLYKSRTKIVDDKLVAEPISLTIAQTFMRKAVRKGTNYVEDSFEANSRDAKLRIKPFLVTRNKVSRAVRGELRRQTKLYIESKIKIKKTEEIFSDIMSNKFQKELSQKLKKIYPLSLCEIRIIEILSKIESPTSSSTPKKAKTSDKTLEKEMTPQTSETKQE